MKRARDRPGVPGVSSRLAILVFVSLVMAAGVAAAEEIGVEWRDGALRLLELPDVLSAEEVREHLESGLTSTLALRAVVRRGRERFEAKGWIAVRYDLWDEVYRVATRGLFGNRQWELASYPALVRWWGSPGIRLPTQELPDEDPETSAAGSGRTGSGKEWQVRIEVDLIPFSSAEERDARRWVSESLRHPERGATDSVAESAEEGPEPLSNVLNVLLATAVRRRPVASWRWSATVPDAAEPPP